LKFLDYVFSTFFETPLQKNRKKSRFLDFQKNVKNVFSNSPIFVHAYLGPYRTRCCSRVPPSTTDHDTALHRTSAGGPYSYGSVYDVLEVLNMELPNRRQHGTTHSNHRQLYASTQTQRNVFLHSRGEAEGSGHCTMSYNASRAYQPCATLASLSTG